MSQLLLYLLQLFYLLSLIGLAVYGLNNLFMTLIYLNTKRRMRHFGKTTTPEILVYPQVTIQLPLYNEKYMIRRLLNAVAHLDYPSDHLQIQVLDDSTDDTTQAAQKWVARYQAEGLNIELIHRTDRSGFKAGALQNGLKTARGELIAIFDADFLPAADWLKRTVPEFADSSLGCLQTRWGHTNHDYNLFTRAIALGIDGHFIVEQTARSQNGLFLNFNGTGGLWRRTCIEDAGGWNTDTLTEDLDLSYRAQMRGWRIGYLPDVVVPAELPVQVEAFKKQQFRWAKGSFQTVKKLIPQLSKSDVPEHVRLMGYIHLTGYFAHPLMLSILILLLPIGLFSPHYLRMFPWSVLASFGPPLMYLVSKTEDEPRVIDRLKMLPLLVLIGFGLSLNNTIAVMQGLFSRNMGTFVRTPKFDVNSTNKVTGKSYMMPISSMVWGELFLAIYSIFTLYVLVPKLGLGIIPWVLVYTFGYLYMAGLNLLQNWQMVHPSSLSASPLIKN